MKKRVYIDTSVVGGYFDDEFCFWTQLFFDSVERGEYTIGISEILTQELKHAPAHIRYFLNDVYPTRLILTDFCVGKWPISSSPSLAVAMAIPTFVSLR